LRKDIRIVEEYISMENKTYYSINEFREKLLPDNSIKGVDNNLEEARKLGMKMARESIMTTKFESISK